MATETARSPVDSRQVQGRRKLRFGSFDEVLADAAGLHETPHRQIGNWTLGMVLKHLGNGMIGSVDGKPFPVNRKMKLLGPLVLRPYLLYVRFPSGFKLPRRAAEVLVPSTDVPYDEGLAQFHAGLARMAETDQRIAHPVIGRLNAAQWNRFHLRHAELHLSFLVPEDAR
ncbi:MAG: DUF1569 domain-containing protein [Pirellulales bacterium]|nr:DUF1569 domain-containing protein [Pirellulales bacterium]